MFRSRLKKARVILLFLALGAAGCGTLTGITAETAQSDSTDGGETSGPESFIGRIIADEYEWFLNPEYLGVTQITSDPLQTVRLVDGSQGRVLDDGRIVFRQVCGSRVHQIALAGTDFRASPITPCSGEVENAGASPTDYGFSALSPDGRWIAVEGKYFYESRTRVALLVFDVASQDLVASFDSVVAPTWLPDGLLLGATGDWFVAIEADGWVLDRFPGDLTGPVNNPSVSPDGSRIAFEYNQQIWGMNADGSGIEVLVVAGRRLRYPVWSPDNRPVLAYLATPKDDQYEPFLHFTDLEGERSWSIGVEDLLSELGTLNGPLTWTE